MTDQERAHFDNGIWLCASCHTMVDKNKGEGFPPEMLRSWKTTHEGIIRSLLLTHRSPLPLLRRFSEEGRIAQDVVDLLEQRGALFMDIEYEVAPYVTESIERLRIDLQRLGGQIRYDAELKNLIKDLANECRSFMNITSNFSGQQWDELRAFRNRVGIFAKRLRQDYGCTIRGELNKIVPT